MTAVIHVRLDREDQHDCRTVARERRAAHTALGLAELLEKRPELGDTCSWAAFAVDAVRWSV